MKPAWLLIFAAVIGAGLLASRADLGNAFDGLFTAGEPVISAIRYTLEIEAGGKRYGATSVVQTFVYRKPKLVPDLGQQYQYRYR